MAARDIRGSCPQRVRSAVLHFRSTPMNRHRRAAPGMSGWCQDRTHAPQQAKLLLDHSISDGDERLRYHEAEINPPLLNRDGKSADQPCDRFQVLAVLVFEESC